MNIDNNQSDNAFDCPHPRHWVLGLYIKASEISRLTLFLIVLYFAFDCSAQARQQVPTHLLQRL